VAGFGFGPVQRPVVAFRPCRSGLQR